MRSIRHAVSARLLRSGASLALGRQEMDNGHARSGTRPLSNADLQLLGALDLWSAAAIRLGIWLMPRRLPATVAADTAVPCQKEA